MANKRAHGDGTVRYNSEKKYWEARFSYVDLDTGTSKRKMFTGGSQREALTKGRKWLQDRNNKPVPVKTLGAWIDIWLEYYAKPKVRVKSFDKYSGCLNCYVKPYLGEIPLASLKTSEVQKLYNMLLEEGGKPIKKKLDDGKEVAEKKGISTSTVKATRRYLSMAIDQAVKEGLVIKNIIKDTEAPKLIKKEICPLTKEQAAALTAVAKAAGEVQYMAVLLPLATGMRLGEVFGLKWDCVDLERGVIHVKRSLITGLKGYNGERFQEPKTAKSRRQIPLPADVMVELKKYKEWQETQKSLLGDTYEDNQLVLTNQLGQIYDTSNFTTRMFKKMLKEAKISESFRYHDLRHTHATLLLVQGVNPKIVQERLGHTTINMTLDTYSHLLPNMQSAAADALTGMFTSG